jgi:hypothetical protein
MRKLLINDSDVGYTDPDFADNLEIIVDYIEKSETKESTENEE